MQHECVGYCSVLRSNTACGRQRKYYCEADKGRAIGQPTGLGYEYEVHPESRKEREGTRNIEIQGLVSLIRHRACGTGR
jgi:hypothetical protein